eukprot:scaffold848_cov88-Phaeocystis_antarctica.AAC.4
MATVRSKPPMLFSTREFRVALKVPVLAGHARWSFLCSHPQVRGTQLPYTALLFSSHRGKPEFQIHGSISSNGRPCSMHVHLCAVTGGAKPVVAPLRPACKEAGAWWFPAPDFVAWPDPPFGANGARRHIWHRSKTANRICATVASVDYLHACMARGSQRVGPQALQLVRFHAAVAAAVAAGETQPQPQSEKPTMPSARRRCCRSCRGAWTPTRRRRCRSGKWVAGGWGSHLEGSTVYTVRE